MSVSPRSPVAASAGQWIIALALAVGLTYAFWQPLWHDGGIVGGDTYSYYFPQKTFYADELKEGRIPLWNPLVGHGYPLVAESQTGVFYPLNLLLFRWLDVNSAYNVQQLTHYVLAFLATWLLGRRLGLGAPGAALAALVFVYGWFAPRLCLEWAILGGVYLPLLAWCAESYLQSGRRRYLVVLSLALGLHLLAGHFNLAFIEVLAVAGYVLLRMWMRPHSAHVAGADASPLQGGDRRLAGAWVVGSLMLGFLLAGIQLAPTWELKQRSQRADVGARHDPGYGHLPPWYLVQVVTPWMWYAPDADADQALQSIDLLTIPASTNKVEAHLYFGLLPLAMAAIGLVVRWKRGTGTAAPFRIWLWLGLAALLYATGWLLPVTRHLPGFSFFMGPGRYGIVTTLAVGLLAGLTLDHWLARRRSRVGRAGLVLVVLGVTLFDLWTVRIGWNHTADGSPNWYADLVSDPPIDHREESEVRRVLAAYAGVPRMYAPFQNMPTLTGFAMTPVYLGLGPAEYFDPALTMPQPAGDPPGDREMETQVAWLQRTGVTHVLSETPLDSAQWPVQLVWQGYDPLLHRAWARREPLFLYELVGTRGRVELTGDPPGSAEITEYSSSRIAIEATAPAGGGLVLTDLAYPGWKLKIDGKPAEWQPADGMFRGTEVGSGSSRLTWEYRPASVFWGGVISTGALIALLAWVIGIGVQRRRRRA